MATKRLSVELINGFMERMVAADGDETGYDRRCIPAELERLGMAVGALRVLAAFISDAPFPDEESGEDD
jgi:hypothetical protein